jgi:hypothetical protein
MPCTLSYGGARLVDRYCFVTTRMGPRNETHVTGSSYAWFIFNLNIKYCYSQMTCYGTHIYRHSLTLTPPHASHCPLPLCMPIPLTLTLFYVHGKPASLARGANTHPLMSLVCYQLFTLCCFTHSKAPHRSSYSVYIDDINNVSCPV